MDLTQLANLGEFIGGVAVLVTLIYLAIQVRQGAAAQRVTSTIITAEAIRSNILSFSTFRRMVADESIAEVWAKARNGDELSAPETIRLQAVVEEVGWTAAAAMQSLRVTENDALATMVPASIALELGDSEPIRRAWIRLSEKLRLNGFDELADGVAAAWKPTGHA